MTNAQILLEATRRQLDHPLLYLPQTPFARRWLSRPCQLPLPFPSLAAAPFSRHLDLLLADWQHYVRSFLALCQLKLPNNL